jgi:hypothetical protein
MFGASKPKFDANKTKVNLKMLINRFNLLTQKKANLAKQQKHQTTSKTSLVWPASAGEAADGPRLAGAWGSLRRALALKESSGAPAGRSLSLFCFSI